jgi:HPt (histidine-containing phosphotransfer) domain-containing protein
MMHAARDTQPAADGTSLSSAMLVLVGGDRELLAELIELFLEDGPLGIETMRRGLTDGDSDVVRRAAHALAGSAANFGDLEVTAMARRLEAHAAAHDIVASSQAFPPLQNAFLLLVDRLMGIQTALACGS